MKKIISLLLILAILCSAAAMAESASLNDVFSFTPESYAAVWNTHISNAAGTQLNLTARTSDDNITHYYSWLTEDILFDLIDVYGSGPNLIMLQTRTTAEAIATDTDAAQELFVSFGRYMSYSAIASVISEMGTMQEAQDRISTIENELGWINAIDIGDVETNPDKWYTGTLAGYPAQIEVIWDAESESIYLCLYITPTATAEAK